ncbi:hypothetical protein F9K81_11670 [Brucella anthropi]|uniref:hypothetical protein n=1 Tax=Brucella anthropi TaxID=529 RepID=UPI00124EBDC4|nr:hypothetical protein [Brucella anthropi]KAB2758001.1 hypothetical protein F9K81_11670 [Brucella anthropi]
MSIENTRFNALRNALYHTARRLRFERLNRMLNFGVVMLGAAAIGDVFNYLNWPSNSLGIAVAMIGAAQLTFDFAGAARTHQQLQRDYYNLLAEIEAKIDPTDADDALWFSAMIRITGDEPPVMRAVDARAYNDAIGAMEWDEGERLVIPWWHRLFKNWCSFEGYHYEKVSEVEARKAAKQ